MCFIFQNLDNKQGAGADGVSALQRKQPGVKGYSNNNFRDTELGTDGELGTELALLICVLTYYTISKLFSLSFPSKSVVQE